MKRWKKIGLWGIGIAGVLVAAIALWLLSRAMPVSTGYVAKYLCSSTFVSTRDPKQVFAEDVRPVNPLARIVDFRIDRDSKTVSATSLGMFESRAVYREGCGCTLVVGGTEAAVGARPPIAASRNRPPHQRPDLPWPRGDQGPVDPADLGIDAEKLHAALDAAFAEPGPDRPRKTRAVVVVYDGKLVAERYASGFNPQMPLLGWSMAKSVTNALVGILVAQGKLDVMQPAPVPEWQADGDPRKKITLDQLLRMSSGLAFAEVYAPLYDATAMLYGSGDMAAYAAGKPLAAAPDSIWSYSSGTANIVARIVRQTVERRDRTYYRFIRKRLFDKIGMKSAVLEPDASGTFVGSSYCLATPRDWARFGLLYLNDGIWQGERILPEGWVAYSTTPTPGAPKGRYGALFWLNAGTADIPADRQWPRAPRDAFAAQGFQEQKVIVIPSRRLVLVRFGATTDRAAWDTDAFISDVLAALP